MKTMQDLSPAKHIFGWSTVVPAVAILLTVTTAFLLGLPASNRIALALIALMVTLPIGFLLGIGSYFFARGALGWQGIFAARRARRAAKTTAAEDAEIEEAIDDLVEGTDFGGHEGPEGLPSADDADEYPLARPTDS